MSKGKVSSNPILMSHSCLLHSDPLLLLVKRVQHPDPSKSKGTNKEHKSNHNPCDEVARLFIQVPKVRFLEVTVDIEHGDDQTVQHVQLAESEEEVDKQPVARPSADVPRPFEEAGQGGHAKVDDCPDDDHAQEDEGKSYQSAQDIHPCDAVVFIPLQGDLKPLFPVYRPDEL